MSRESCGNPRKLHFSTNQQKKREAGQRKVGSGGQELSNHTVIAFDVDLQAIRAEIISMARLVEQQIAGAAAALVNRDAEIAGSVIAMDVRVNEMLHEIETTVVEIVARRQP